MHVNIPHTKASEITNDAFPLGLDTSISHFKETLSNYSHQRRADRRWLAATLRKRPGQKIGMGQIITVSKHVHAFEKRWIETGR